MSEIKKPEESEIVADIKISDLINQADRFGAETASWYLAECKKYGDREIMVVVAFEESAKRLRMLAHEEFDEQCELDGSDY